MSMTATSFSFGNQTVTGSLGTSSQKIRINNTTANNLWSLTIAASSPTDF